MRFPSSTAASGIRQDFALAMAIVLLASLWNVSTAFTLPSIHLHKTPMATGSPNTVVSSSGLKMASVFDEIGKFFEDMSGKNKPKDKHSNDDDEDDDEYAGSTRLLSIPVESIKLGGLRLFLMFYCMGMQNTPDRGSWKANQPTTEEYVVDMYYQDQTAALTVKLTETQITIDRVGSTPSTSYLMQESVIVDGILDELQACAIEQDVADKDRLLLLPEPRDAIEKARKSLAFG
jgi:hypothetical protein